MIIAETAPKPPQDQSLQRGRRRERNWSCVWCGGPIGAGVCVLGPTEPCGETGTSGPCPPFSLRSTVTLGEFVSGSSGLKRKKCDKALSCVRHELGDVCPNFQLLPGALHSHLTAVHVCQKARFKASLSEGALPSPSYIHPGPPSHPATMLMYLYL